MKKKIQEILKGEFLVSDDAVKNWKFILFASVLAVVMITSSHNADKKVFALDKLNKEVLELRSEFVDVREQVQQMRLESNVTEKLSKKGLYPSTIAPKKIRVVSK
ncbi:S-adenosyl-methyltransferase [Zhouia spongiae]|uniref:S-adenosyl-methyltransferase n=1 Tax=Zhouia spongiae TaxID=2202721 RepID=A0ABY3YMR3_9FLAO|nr:FtsL-like putative cell division protein [Zhouia spongiae]UNY99097.1 S-adenosyl-methyltransferase [Zhouia spongiae]